MVLVQNCIRIKDVQFEIFDFIELLKKKFSEGKFGGIVKLTHYEFFQLIFPNFGLLENPQNNFVIIVLIDNFANF